MIAIVIPFRPKSESANWALDVLLLKRTLVTILRQTGNDYHVYVLYTDFPDTNLVHDCLTFSKFPFVSFSIRELNDYESLLSRHYDDVYFRRHLDKSRKIMWGCKLAKEAGYHYIMNVDSDDLISNRLLPFILQHENEVDGWYIPGGYVHEYDKKYLLKIKSSMHLLNGSTHVVNVSLIKVPNMESKEWTEINFFTDHGYLKKRVQIELGGQLIPIPFKAVVYSRTGINNISEPHLIKLSLLKKCIKTILLFKPLSSYLIIEFNLNAYKTELLKTIRNKSLVKG